MKKTIAMALAGFAGSLFGWACRLTGNEDAIVEMVEDEIERGPVTGRFVAEGDEQRVIDAAEKFWAESEKNA